MLSKGKSKNNKDISKEKKSVSQLGNVKVFDYLLKEVITEKATILKEKNIIVFKVSRRANKFNLRKVLKLVFNVEVNKINILNTAKKPVYRGRKKGEKKSYKKAIVYLSKEELSKIKI